MTHLLTDLYRSLCILDTETTSLDFKNAEIIEFGCAIYSDNQWQTTGSLHKASEPITPEVSAVTHITNRMVQDKVLFSDSFGIYDDLVDSIKNNAGQVALVAHNAVYDSNVFKFNYPDSKLNNQQWICTMRFAKKLFADDQTVTQFNLPYLRYRFDLDIPEDIPHHRASSDAYMTAKLFEYLVDVAVDKGILTNDSNYLEQLIDYLNKPIVQTVMPFGKHKGKKFADLPLDYLTWLINNADSLNEEKAEYDPDFAASVINEFTRRGIV